MNDLSIIAKQLKRTPASRARPVVRCAAGFPVVTKNMPVTDEAAPFPTLYWLTCPALRKAISRLEAGNMIARLEQRLAEDPEMRARLLASDSAYRRERDRQKTGQSDVGIAGNRHPFKLKCLHAQAADYLAARLNPVGRLVLQTCPLPEDCRRCESL